MSVLVYQAINAIGADLSECGVAKCRTNLESNYLYRSIDDVMAALAPLLSRHKLCVLPRVLDRCERLTKGNSHVTVRVAFDMVSILDGSKHVIETFGEAIDESDKGTAKAISSAYKSAMLQAFCIPVGHEDSKPQVSRIGRLAVPEPPEGWNLWVEETVAILKSCESAEAIDRLCEIRRPSLNALQRAKPLLYGEIGEALSLRLLELRPKSQTRPSPPPTTRPTTGSKHSQVARAAFQSASC